MDRLACSRLPSLDLFLSHNRAPSHAPIQTSRYAPSLPFCALFPGPQLPTVRRHCSGHWVCTWVPPPLHVHAHVYFSFPLMHTLFFTWSPFFFLIPPCLLTYLLTVTQTHLCIPTHTPPSSARRCSHSQETRQPGWCWGLRSFPNRHPCGPSLGPASSSGIRGRGGGWIGNSRN